MGIWLSVLPSTANGMELGSQEWRDSLFLCYCIEPPDLPSHCESCGAEFSIYHAIDCNKGVLVSACHNDLRDGVADLAGKAFTPAHVCTYPKTFTGHAVQGGKTNPKAKARRHRCWTRGGRREIS